MVNAKKKWEGWDTTRQISTGGIAGGRKKCELNEEQQWINKNWEEIVSLLDFVLILYERNMRRIVWIIFFVILLYNRFEVVFYHASVSTLYFSTFFYRSSIIFFSSMNSWFFFNLSYKKFLFFFLFLFWAPLCRIVTFHCPSKAFSLLF